MTDSESAPVANDGSPFPKGSPAAAPALTPEAMVAHALEQVAVAKDHHFCAIEANGERILNARATYRAKVATAKSERDSMIADLRSDTADHRSALEALDGIRKKSKRTRKAK